MQDDGRRSWSVPQRMPPGNNRLGVRRLGCESDKFIFAAGTGFFSIERDMFSEADMLPYPYAPASTRLLTGSRAVLPVPAVP
jgi:hypothetical protein